MLKIFLITISSVSLCILMYILFATTPVSSGPFGILIVFISAYFFLTGVFTYIINLISHVIARLSVYFVSKKPVQPYSLRKSYYFSTIIAAAPIMILSLQSVGAVGLYEYLLVIIFVVIGCIYVSKK